MIELLLLHCCCCYYGLLHCWSAAAVLLLLLQYLLSSVQSSVFVVIACLHLRVLSVTIAAEAPSGWLVGHGTDFRCGSAETSDGQRESSYCCRASAFVHVC